MRVFFTFSLVFIFSTLLLGFGFKARYAEHFENPRWDASKPPILEEAPVQNQKAMDAWQKAMQQPSPLCDSPQSWVASNGSVLEARGIKEHNIEVRGVFLRFRTCLLADDQKATAKGQGWVEMSSWNSGQEARDRRVTRYVFGVEQDGQAVTPFEFEISPWKPVTSNGAQQAKAKAPQTGENWTATLKAKAVFRGLPVSAEFPVQVIQQKPFVRVASTASQQIRFMSDPVLEGFKRMMELCNHRFLASFALVDFDLNLLPVSMLTPGTSKKN